MKEEILQWLRSGQPYEQGVDLYAKYCNNATLLKNFQRSETKDRKEKLAYKLLIKAGLPEKFMFLKPQDIPGYKKQDVKTQEKVQKIAPKTPAKEIVAEYKYAGKIPWGELPKEIQLKIVERGDLQKQRKTAHEGLSKIPPTNTPENINARKTVCALVDTLTGKINELQEEIKHFEKTKTIKKAPEKPVEDAEKTGIELVKKLNNLKSQRTKAKKAVEDLPAGPKKAAKEAKLKEIIAQIEEIEQKIGK
jgi:hypothetical protein